ncbi:class I SAM-dependent methyltransferase [Paenibacillus albiflavus]|uniref:Class I SAM-dependent methyltransferase n=1 Tax=Paenibacillus albiflavus TaxID=2545760 RepID=A0A4R4ELF3_9BACL|nr:class I SAM-dependent methyltransferase [Paenibacillus albiflavus]TCZ79281.1 class I SAM-dependent methyltransferase [Paenibacillus albiflavus]
MNHIINYYNSFDEWGRLDREPLEYTVNFHHIQSNLLPQGRILDNGAGPGKYSINLAKLGYQMTLTDLTPSLVEIARDKAVEAGVQDQFDGFHAADARDLSLFGDNQFDASIMLGPLYHLQAEEDRTKAIKELHRVTKKDGYVFVAFMSKTRFLINSLTRPENWKPNHTVQGITEFLRTGEFNHSDEGRFTGAYYFDIQDINPLMEAHGFETVKLVGSSSVAGAMDDEQWNYWRQRGEEEFQEMMKLVMKESENPYMLGSSSHLLYIGKKI